MNPELIYRFEFARLLVAQLDAAMAVQECSGADLAFHRSGKFWRAQIIRGSQLSVEELAPIRAETLPNGGGEIAEIIWALEYGEVPAPKDIAAAKSAKKKRFQPRINASVATNGSVPLIPSDEKSSAIMSQWRGTK